MARRKKQDEDPSQEDMNNSDETFGLPEIEYQPLEREESQTTASTSTSSSESTYEHTETPKEMEREETQNEYNTTYYDKDDDNGGSPWPKILGVGALLLVAAGLIWFFGFYRPKQQAIAAERAKQEREADERKRIADLAEQKRLENERRVTDSLAQVNAKPTAGVIETLNERTGRYYVIVASGIDGDLIQDYAKKLAPKGLSPKIIPPHGKIKFYRLAIAEGDTYASTQATADQLKGEYSDGAWVVKY
jgi:hypothetical protein